MFQTWKNMLRIYNKNPTLEAKIANSSRNSFIHQYMNYIYKFKNIYIDKYRICKERNLIAKCEEKQKPSSSIDHT